VEEEAWASLELKYAVEMNPGGIPHVAGDEALLAERSQHLLCPGTSYHSAIYFVRFRVLRFVDTKTTRQGLELKPSELLRALLIREVFVPGLKTNAAGSTTPVEGHLNSRASPVDAS
jgi:hypothetical protein